MAEIHTEYYLTHLGVDRWVLREQLTSTHRPCAEPKHLFILCSVSLSTIEEQLFANMLQSIGIDYHEVQFIFIQHQPLESVIFSKEDCFLILGHSAVLQAKEWAKGDDLSFSVIPHPAEIVEFPTSKAGVYVSLCELQKELNRV